MATQITAIKPVVEDEPATAPCVTFAPQVSTHQVATLTLGRKTFNDSDKSNYFE